MRLDKRLRLIDGKTAHYIGTRADQSIPIRHKPGCGWPRKFTRHMCVPPAPRGDSLSLPVIFGRYDTARKASCAALLHLAEEKFRGSGRAGGEGCCAGVDKVLCGATFFLCVCMGTVFFFLSSRGWLMMGRCAGCLIYWMIICGVTRSDL